MKTILQFNITHDDNVYTAEGVNAPIATEAETFEELQHNIRDAVSQQLRLSRENKVPIA